MPLVALNTPGKRRLSVLSVCVGENLIRVFFATCRKSKFEGVAIFGCSYPDLLTDWDSMSILINVSILVCGLLVA